MGAVSSSFWKIFLSMNSAVNTTSKLISTSQDTDDEIDGGLPELHIATKVGRRVTFFTILKVDEATGKLVSTDMTEQIGVDEITSGRDKKLSGLSTCFVICISWFSCSHSEKIST